MVHSNFLYTTPHVQLTIMNKLSLKIVTQSRQLLELADVSSITAPSSEGEITILPQHVALVTKLETGEIRYTHNGKEEIVIVSKGFLTIDPDNKVTIMVDGGTHEREVSAEKAAAAVKKAEEIISTTTNRRELLLAEASLKRALLEQRLAQRTRRSAV